MKHEDFPAAHSMDSGWFAVDEDGNLAHFDTGEAGAMPHEATHVTGEAGAGDGDAIWFRHVLPWIARNAQDAKVLQSIPALYALFDTVEHARAALEMGGGHVDKNELLVFLDPYGEEPLDPETLPDLPGFVGYAPDPWEAMWEHNPERLLPLAVYEHGDWDIPGHYVRAAAPEPTFRLDDEVHDRITRMPVRFAEAQEVQLADFYANDGCISWSEADLRTGELPEPEDGPIKSFFARLKEFLKG